MNDRNIPVVDLDKFKNGNLEDRDSFVQKLGKAFNEVGFVSVLNHGVSKEIVDNFYNLSKAFFSLPIEKKRSYLLEGLAGQRGYTAFGTEHAKQSKVADLKEFFQIGQYVDDNHSNKKEYPDNVYVDAVPQFNAISEKLYKAFEASGATLLRAIALFLDLDEFYFDQYLVDGNSILRAIHYPPITEEPESAIRAEQHEDINLITLLVGASAGGLQLLTSDNQWLDITPQENEIVINVGDMLQRLTNNYLKSTTHRVVNPPKHQWHIPRLSIPFFLHPRSEMSLNCLDNCVSSERPLSYESITAGAYLEERLREIGLKK